MLHLERAGGMSLTGFAVIALVLMVIGGAKSAYDAINAEHESYEHQRIELSQRVQQKLEMATPEEINATVWKNIEGAE